ncbi:MAG: flagellar biosynthesis repressor FlbT [Pseudomonadota bacterium]
MALKVELKPGERIIIGESLITNGDQRARLLIDGEQPILREKDVLTPETASTPAQQVYLAVQMMYLKNDISGFQDSYFSLIGDLTEAAPSTKPIVDEINNQILTGSFYKALKVARGLIAYEGALLENVQSSGGAGVPIDEPTGD